MLSKIFQFYWGHSFLIALAFVAVLVTRPGRGWFEQLCRPIARLNNWLPLIPRFILLLAMTHFLFYLSLPSYSDYGEPVIPVLATNLLNGATIYGSLDSGKEIIGSNYGPLTFVLQAAALWISPDIVASKVPGIIAAIASIGIFYFVARDVTSTRRLALTGAATMVALLSFHLHYWFWCRPDSFLILLVALGILAYHKLTPQRALIVLGLLAGLAVNLKIFSPIYLMPIAMSSLLAAPRSALVGALVGGALLFLLAAVAPFLIPGVHFIPYFESVSAMGEQGTEPSLILSAFFYALLIGAFPAVSYWTHISQPRYTIMGATAVLTVVLALVLAGKPGSGAGIMMPFIPLSIFLGLSLQTCCVPRPATAVTYNLSYALVAIFLISAPIWAYSWYQMSKQLFRHEYAKSEEAREVFKLFPGAEMGHGDAPDESSDEFHRVQKSFLGGVARADFVNYADQRKARMGMERVHSLLTECTVPSWVFSNAVVPFTGKGYGVEMFSDDIRHLFAADYQKVYTGRFYSVWKCRAGAEASDLPNGRQARAFYNSLSSFELPPLHSAGGSQ